VGFFESDMMQSFQSAFLRFCRFKHRPLKLCSCPPAADRELRGILRSPGERRMKSHR